MRRAELAKHLIEAATDAERRRLLAANTHITDERLAGELRSACYAVWTVEPVKAQRAAAAIKLLARAKPTDGIAAIASWISGISDITKGKFGSAAGKLEAASILLSQIGRNSDGAQADVARLLALAMLGRYDEAIETGQQALKIFAAEGDDLAAGKIEMNLSNIISRQALHHEAERYCLSARKRFIRAREKSWQAMAENGLANTYAELNDFTKAQHYYELALVTARAEKMTVTVAEIEASLGNLALLRGQYAAALRFLESSRQRYDDLAMPHQSAIADLEIADIYSELNLLTEAADVYERISPVFQKLRLRAEEARSRLNHGRTAARLGEAGLARKELKTALRLFAREKNYSGQMSVLLSQGEQLIAGRKADQALAVFELAAKVVRHDDNPRHEISLNLLEGEALALAGSNRRAASRLTKASELAKRHQQTNSLQTALNSLGKLAAATGELKKASTYFSNAAKLVEGLRSNLAADEFSMAFLASRLEPFENLADLLLSQGKIADAFRTIERGRSRSLLDAMKTRQATTNSSNKLQGRADELRAELNFYYKKLDRSTGDEDERLRADILRGESDLSKIIRQINSLAGEIKSKAERFDLKHLQNRLGSASLIEYIERDGMISAFVVTGKNVKYVSGITDKADVADALDDLHFQFGAMRYGDGGLGRFAAQIKGRTDRCLMRLYDLLVRPLEKYFAGTRLIVVPAGPLHYVPFHALHDGERYMVERFETSYAPSAAVWSALQHAKPRKFASTLLIGYADKRIPLVENEVRSIRRILPASTSLTGSKATFAAFTQNAGSHDLIHLACHGQFRHDNPMYSSLHLADGWVTVQDICSQRLRASLVTLSACETGLNKIYAGDEILGLARGFLSAGASSIVVSLWTVNDAAASRLMTSFYNHLQRGDSVAASLRDCQLEAVRRGDHPYLWSPFVLIGR
ncbi:CHAT domain-containing protein [soil metagenome]